jgi:hypothetical protein
MVPVETMLFDVADFQERTQILDLGQDLDHMGPNDSVSNLLNNGIVKELWIVFVEKIAHIECVHMITSPS